jgi:hypothetical protein
MISGGYILQPRIIDESELIHEPPVVRELWLYLLRKVNYKDNGKFKRGSGFFSLDDISDDLHWYIGFRRMKYSKPQLTKTLRKLRERNMIATTKATRGIFVTICKYDYYQDSKNYEGNDEEITKELRKNFGGHTKNKKVKEEKENKESKEELTPTTVVVEKTWRDDFSIYKKELMDAFSKLPANLEFIKKQERFYPDVDIILSVEKAIDCYWGMEAGWMNKKEDKKLINPDWEKTFKNAIGKNRVFKRKNGTQLSFQQDLSKMDYTK